jgi:hypothetical protein
MNEKTIKTLAILVLVGAVFASIITIIDLKLKQELVEMALEARRNLELIKAYAGVMPHAQSTEEKPDGTDNLRDSAIPLPPDIVDIHDARVEKGGPISENGAQAPRKRAARSAPRNGNQGIPQQGE